MARRSRFRLAPALPGRYRSFMAAPAANPDQPFTVLAPQQARALRRSAFIQTVIFGLLALTLVPLGLGGVIALLLKSGSLPLAPLCLLLAVFGGFLALGLPFAWLAPATLAWAMLVDNLRVAWFEDEPFKETFHNRIGGASHQLAGAWLRHDGLAYAVELTLFRRIPDQGRFRFFYVRRPGFPFVLVPRQVIDFAPAAAPKSKWEIDPDSYARALAAHEEKERQEGAKFPGGKPFPVTWQETDLAPAPPAETADYYAVNDRPVKLVHLPDGGLDVQALNMRTGEFERDMNYLSRCISGEGDVDTFTAAEFAARVAAIRASLPGHAKA